MIFLDSKWPPFPMVTRGHLPFCNAVYPKVCLCEDCVILCAWIPCSKCEENFRKRIPSIKYVCEKSEWILANVRDSTLYFLSVPWEPTNDCIYSYANTYSVTCTCTNIYTCMYTYTIQIHACIYIHIHTYII